MNFLIVVLIFVRMSVFISMNIFVMVLFVNFCTRAMAMRIAAMEIADKSPHHKNAKYCRQDSQTR
jgi:hypothetical protein